MQQFNFNIFANLLFRHVSEPVIKPRHYGKSWSNFAIFLGDEDTITSHNLPLGTVCQAKLLVHIFDYSIFNFQFIKINQEI